MFFRFVRMRGDRNIVFFDAVRCVRFENKSYLRDCKM